ncbi:hypothetical protein RF11_04032 [Thelohanellus kitauei]|uniref:Uncharacterized protein n=1 Tax=Thelohanellus kitauei TaxID=669202 RepID=A0A0C2N222_THEKT|nr:hypothetical protein RF11_04032 [Thelohanellus kitauei]
MFDVIKITNKFNDKPTLLYGEVKTFGRFGLAVSNMKDSNQDGFEGTIGIHPDIIILQPNYSRDFPALYIFTSGQNGFDDKHAKKIVLDYKPTGTYPQYAYGLYSGFDWNNDEVNGNGSCHEMLRSPTLYKTRSLSFRKYFDSKSPYFVR